MNKIQRFIDKAQTGTPLVCLTAYTTPMARSLAPYVDLLLVGDSMGTVIYGMDSTQDVTLEMMCAHGAAVVRAEANVPVIIDMPHGSYEASNEQALNNAKQLMQETGADGLKLEGGKAISERISTLVDAGIPVFAHIGLLPQSAPDEGGYKIKGKTEEQILNLIEDAKAIEEAGSFAVVIEGTIEEAAARIDTALNIPTIGIGASAKCSGQILVSEDLLGITHGHRPKFAPNYGHVNEHIDKATARFAADVRDGQFPKTEHLYKKKA